MGPMNLYFDVRDIFRAPRLALSGKKIWIMFIANIIGFVIYWILTMISLMVAGLPLGEAISRYGLYPCLVGYGGNVFAYIIWIVGLLAWLVALLLACTAVARVTYKQLKGDEFYSSGDAWKYVKKHWHAAVFTHLSIVIIALFFVVLAVIFALIGKIPYFGELFVGIPYLLWFCGSLFVVYTVIVLIVSIFFTHAIVATLEEDTMGAVFQNYSITWSQPWRMVLYLILTYGLIGAGVLVFGYFMVMSYSLFTQLFGHDLLMGMKLSNMVGWASHIVLPNCSSIACTSIPNVPTSLGPTEYVGGFFIAISLFFINIIVLSYALSIQVVAETASIIIFKKKSDDENLLERKDEEELEVEEEKETEWGTGSSEETSDETETTQEAVEDTDEEVTETDTDSNEEKDT